MGVLAELDIDFVGLFVGATSVLVCRLGVFLCVQYVYYYYYRIIDTLPFQSSDYDHGQGLNANGALTALIPVLRALAVQLKTAHLVAAIDSLACVVPAVDSVTLNRAVSLICADGTTRLDRALAIAACVHQTATSLVRF
jgi:hypothetical protein